jgi:cytochrome P450
MQIAGFWYRRNPWFERCRARYGSPFTLKIRMGSAPFVVVGEPDQVKQMFMAPPDVLWAGDGSSELHKFFGSPALAYMEEDEHLTRRKLINRSMHGDAMGQISTSVASVIERQIGSWPRDEVVELFPRLRRLSIEVIRHVNFGPDPDPRLDELVDVMVDLYEPGDQPISFVEDQYLPRPAVTLLSAVPLYRRILELRAHADRIIYEVLAERRRDGATEGQDLVSTLLSATSEDGSPIGLQEIRNELMTNFLAGSGTTGSVMSWAVATIARKPAVRERLVDEIESGDDDAYLTATVQEILRRKPPLPQIIPRLVRKPFELGDYVIPPGARVVGSAHLVHHNPDVYPDPHDFRPERFLGTKPGTYTWIPFGGGRRRCLGKGIAELEMKAALTAIFSRFDVRPDRPDPEPDKSLHVLIGPGRGARVALSERA